MFPLTMMYLPTLKITYNRFRRTNPSNASINSWLHKLPKVMIAMIVIIFCLTVKFSSTNATSLLPRNIRACQEYYDWFDGQRRDNTASHYDWWSLFCHHDVINKNRTEKENISSSFPFFIYSVFVGWVFFFRTENELNVLLRRILSTATCFIVVNVGWK